MPIISLLVILYRKCQKQAKYWKQKMEDYNVQSDKGAVMDSQDEFTHGVQLMDPNVMPYKKKKGWCCYLIRDIRHADA